MLTPEEIYITDYTELFLDLYRFGNSTSPRFDNIRPHKDAMIIDRNGIKYILADGNGVSAFSSIPSGKKNTWKLRKGTILPAGVKLVMDKRLNHENHYMLAPSHTMKLSEFHALMDKLRECAVKIN
ncbi:hypothetical protein BTA51_08255 [Hahella sp. CCB-MM4]|uniref:Tse2 family ADP-ribosyltransferase toxin n=1 Tax=Hahella sp. (strain CCB-MM4) TaxID=1926491 RepID=UPI000B9C563D|nr:hypothetical protein [Hahella sp. CCB-MM4]OZG73791.1 hypothetical protein BTA51_08255 [Hahella sp. CCB-MM4]